jgi:hypothetical protein
MGFSWYNSELRYCKVRHKGCVTSRLCRVGGYFLIHFENVSSAND